MRGGRPISGASQAPGLALACPHAPSACHAVRAQFDAKRLEGDVEYVETDEEEKGIKFAQLVADRQIAFSARPRSTSPDAHDCTRICRVCHPQQCAI